MSLDGWSKKVLVTVILMFHAMLGNMVNLRVVEMQLLRCWKCKKFKRGLQRLPLMFLIMRIFWYQRRPRFSSEEINAMVLTKMKDTAEAFLGKKIKDVVVPVVMVAKDKESGRIDEELRPAAAPWCRSLL